MPDLQKIWLQLPLLSHFQLQPATQKQLQLKSHARLSHFAPTRLFVGSRKRRNISAQNTLRRVQSHSLRSLGSNSCNFFIISHNCHKLMYWIYVAYLTPGESCPLVFFFSFQNAGGLLKIYVCIHTYMCIFIHSVSDFSAIIKTWFLLTQMTGTFTMLPLWFLSVMKKGFNICQMSFSFEELRSRELGNFFLDENLLEICQMSSYINHLVCVLMLQLTCRNKFARNRSNFAGNLPDIGQILGF